MSEAQIPMWQRWAQFRFSVIGELLSSPPQKGQLQKAIARMAEKTYQHPIDANRRICIGASTIERWYYKAKAAADPIAALGRKIRADSGIRWSMSQTLFDALKAQYETHRRWNVQLHYDNLVALAQEQPHLKPLPSYKTVLRCMRDNGWARSHQVAQPTSGQQQAAERLQRREVRGFEVSHVHGLWHLDFHQAKISILESSGRWYRPMALAILDDRSRLCCHLQFYLSETAECLVHGLTQAFMKRGLPRALMTDNGAAMLAEETRRGLRRLAIHSEIKTTPLQRMLNGPDVARPSPDSDSLRLAFTRRIQRSPRRSDATVVVDGIRYELPVRFGHLRSVIVRAAGWDKSRMTLVDADTDAALARLLPQDKAKNASGQRRAIHTTIPTTPSTDNPMPALLRKWLADYAATGLPPAYLPKEEICHE